MSKVNKLLSIAEKLETKYAGPIYFQSKNDRVTVSERLYVAANQALRDSNLLEKATDDPVELKRLDDQLMISGIIEEASDNLSQALVMYRALLSK